MHFESVTANVFTVVGILLEPSTSIVKPKGSLEEYLSIRQTPIIVTSITHGITPSLAPSLSAKLSEPVVEAT